MSPHECSGLAECLDHPRWHVLAPWPPGETWVINSPRLGGFYTAPRTSEHKDVLTAAQVLARAAHLDRQEA